MSLRRSTLTVSSTARLLIWPSRANFFASPQAQALDSTYPQLCAVTT